MSEKYENYDIKIDNPVLKKLDHFWFYYKWHTIIALFFVLVFVVCTLQMCANAEDDCMVMYAGPYAFMESETVDLRSSLNAAMPRDFNGDGKKYTGLALLTIYSDEQAKAINSSGEGVINAYYNSEQLKQYDNLIMAGEYSVCFLEPWLYERVATQGGFRKLSDVLGYTPEGAIDDYAIRLYDTEFGRYYAKTLCLPEDTVICMRTVGTVASLFRKNATAKAYAISEEMFKAIVAFEAP